MILEANRPYGLNFGEDLEYISTFTKGKVKSKVINYRLLFRGVNTGKEYLLFLGTRENFFGRPKSHSIEYVDQWKTITPDHLKNKNYNYYKIGFDPITVEDFLDEWKKSDPMIHVGNYQHQFLTKINGYTWTYKFNNKLF